MDPLAVGERIKARRRALNLSPGALAGLAGTNPAYISRLEQGHRPRAGSPTLERVARALGYANARALLGDEAAPAPPEAWDARELAELAAEMRRVAPEHRAAAWELVLQVARSFARLRRADPHL